MLGLVAFNDIGKQAKDLLSKDYPFGSVKVEVKTTAPNGVVCVLHDALERGKISDNGGVHIYNRPSRSTVNVTTRVVSLLVISRPSTLIRSRVSLSPKPGLLPTISTARLSSRTTSPVSIVISGRMVIGD